MDKKNKRAVFYQSPAFYIAYFITIIPLICVVSYWTWNAKLDGKEDWFLRMPFYYTISVVLSCILCFALWVILSMTDISSETINTILLGVLSGSLTPLILSVLFVVLLN